MKSIIISCDGTWNTPGERDGGVPTPTNVVRIYNATADIDDKGNPQHKYYHPGVGTDGSWWEKVVGGGTGRGLDHNIMSAYRELCDHYQPGDAIFLFGFSRGAYTVRSLGGLIARCGLLDTSDLGDKDAWARVEDVFRTGYRTKKATRPDWDHKGWTFHNGPKEVVPLRFMGVWDTVGALGIPDDMALLNLLDRFHDYTFHDTRLSSTVKTARHALALDEMRASFQPTLWTAIEGLDVKQVWFPGVHSDVGGGYRETGLSDGALAWMIEEAQACGLAFNPAMTKQISPDFLDVLHDSCDGVFTLLPTQPRSVPFIKSGPDIHPSAVSRNSTPPIHQCPYRQACSCKTDTPLTLNIFAREPWNETGLWLDAGTAYTFESTGEWMDRSITCGPGGTDDGKFQVGELVQLAGTALGKFEGLFRKLTRNPSAEIRGTRRHEDLPWFSLVGAIANGGGVNAKLSIEPHEYFLIGGKRLTYTPKKSGYFFAYANDAWGFYGNNRGRVTLMIA